MQLGCDGGRYRFPMPSDDSDVLHHHSLKLDREQFSSVLESSRFVADTITTAHILRTLPDHLHFI